jgi:hypothetical protein
MTIRDIAARSRATPAFIAALESFQRENRPNPRIQFDRHAPAVKVGRTLTQLLVQNPDLAVESVAIAGASGCEYFRGELKVVADGEEHRIRFYWDCRWKAQQQGWVDYFGFADQIRAAREFDYDCFREWETLPPDEPLETVSAPA